MGMRRNALGDEGGVGGVGGGGVGVVRGLGTTAGANEALAGKRKGVERGDDDDDDVEEAEEEEEELVREWRNEEEADEDEGDDIDDANDGDELEEEVGAMPCQQQCHVSSATSAAVPHHQQPHVSSPTSAAPRQQGPATMTGSSLGLPGQQVDESIDEYHQRVLAHLALTEVEVQRQVAAEAARVQAEAEAAAEKQWLQAEAEADAQALRKEAQELLQRHEATSIDKLKFWHFEPSASHDNTTSEEQHKEFFSKFVTQLVYTCNHQQSELDKQLQELAKQHQELAKQHQDLVSLRWAMQNHKGLHEDATRALHSRVQDLEKGAPRPNAGESSNAPSTRQLEERVDHVVAMLGDITTFVAPATISEQLGTLQTELRQLHQLPDNDCSTSKHYKMPTFRIEKFDDYTHQDPVVWWDGFTTELGIHEVPEYLFISALFLNVKGGCQIWLSHMATINGVQLAFLHVRREFYNRSCATLSLTLSDHKQYTNFAEIIEKARKIIKTNRAAAHEESAWQPTYVEKGKFGLRPQHVAAVQPDNIVEDLAATSTSREGDQVAVVQPRSNNNSRGKGMVKTALPAGNGQPVPWVKFNLIEAEYKYCIPTPLMDTGVEVVDLHDYVAKIDREFKTQRRSLDERVEHLRTVLDRLRQAKYKANRDKCEFARQELEYLGHYVTPQGIHPLVDKIEVIRAWPEPTNTTDVRSFMGLAGYYQRFITGYSRIVAPMTRLQSSKVPFVFDDDARRSFQALKTTMLMAPVLSIYDPTLPTRVTTDASGYGIGAVLEQHDGDDWHPVEYFIHKVPPINSLDDARKKELLEFECSMAGNDKAMDSVRGITQHAREETTGPMERAGLTLRATMWKASQKGAKQDVEDGARILMHKRGRQREAAARTADAATRALTLTNTGQELWCSALATKLRGRAFSTWENYYTHRTRPGEAPTLADFTAFLYDRDDTLHDATDALDRVIQTEWRGSSAPADLERHIRVFQDARLICDKALLPEVLLTNRFVVSLPTDYRIELWRQSFASSEQAYEAARQYQKMRSHFSDTPSSLRSTATTTQSRGTTCGRSSFADRFRRPAQPGAPFSRRYSSLEYGTDASVELDPTLEDAPEDIELRDVIQYHLDDDTVPVA
ncbi:hypothetical protein CBR_g26255 [Chara braunii]|uniref:Reverse transcriptase/retrotransposon-derived protein RNase H-like domain-containing protein n=1 Tax=Chara braunii TaxID=69332 RepID=A0A388L7B9_CHABU|nr:hypothetical protein CBR_g26255 [Chara braunii]|eukprot:GBG78221.1 hypothetical protein CBR_g26255 [Chara braunii]